MPRPLCPQAGALRSRLERRGDDLVLAEGRQEEVPSDRSTCTRSVTTSERRSRRREGWRPEANRSPNEEGGGPRTSRGRAERAVARWPTDGRVPGRSAPPPQAPCWPHPVGTTTGGSRSSMSGYAGSRVEARGPTPEPRHRPVRAVRDVLERVAVDGRVDRVTERARSLLGGLGTGRSAAVQHSRRNPGLFEIERWIGGRWERWRAGLLRACHDGVMRKGAKARVSLTAPLKGRPKMTAFSSSGCWS